MRQASRDVRTVVLPRIETEFDELLREDTHQHTRQQEESTRKTHGERENNRKSKVIKEEGYFGGSGDDRFGREFDAQILRNDVVEKQLLLREVVAKGLLSVQHL
jgi:hypothetical protein